MDGLEVFGLCNKMEPVTPVTIPNIVLDFEVVENKETIVRTYDANEKSRRAILMFSEIPDDVSDAFRRQKNNRHSSHKSPRNRSV